MDDAEIWPPREWSDAWRTGPHVRRAALRAFIARAEAAGDPASLYRTLSRAASAFALLGDRETVFELLPRVLAIPVPPADDCAILLARMVLEHFADAQAARGLLARAREAHRLGRGEPDHEWVGFVIASVEIRIQAAEAPPPASLRPRLHAIALRDPDRMWYDPCLLDALRILHRAGAFAPEVRSAARAMAAHLRATRDPASRIGEREERELAAILGEAARPDID